MSIFGEIRGHDGTRTVAVMIRVRAEHDRKVPPGYTGSGRVQVLLRPGYRYIRLNPATGRDVYEGMLACAPDEAVQIVATGAADFTSPASNRP